MTRQLVTIARMEWTAAIRLKWMWTLTLAFATLAVAAAYSAGAANELSGADGFARTTMTLIPVVLILVPLSALVLGVSGQVSESGSEGFLFSQPVGRATVLAGRWFGECAALVAAIALGLGTGGVAVASANGADGVIAFAFFVAMAAALAVMFLSIAAAIAAASDKRSVALGLGVFAWFFFVLLYDGAMLSAARWLSGPRGGRILFASVLGNPVDLIRVAVLSFAGTPNVLGAAGDAWVRFLGGATASIATVAAAVVAWSIAPLAIGCRLMRDRDL